MVGTVYGMDDNAKAADLRSTLNLSTASVDVVLLAMVIALHMTKKDQNLKLLLMLLLVVHVVATTRAAPPVGQVERGDDTPTAEPTATERDDTVQNSPALGVAKATTSTVRSAEYDRQLNSPAQLSRTREVLPTSSDGANGKLVNSRTNFYRDIIDV